MNKKSKSLLIFILAFSFLLHVKAQDFPSRAIVFEAAYIGDNVVNFSGGIKTGYNYLGIANLMVSLDTEKARLWRGGQFYVYAANTHGATPSANLLGDIQVASNIEAGKHSYLQELWYKQTFKKWEWTVGLQDLNVEFTTSELGGLYLNSSFGILPIISGNVTAPIFPLTSLGLTAKWNISDNATWVAAIYDGCPTGFDDNPHNIKWEFLSGDGVLAVTEFQKHLRINTLPGTYKLGVFTHNHIIHKTLGSIIPDSVDFNISGFYVNADQILWQKEQQNLGLFTQFGFSHSQSITSDFYWGMGVNYTGLFSSDGKDILGLAIAYESLKDSRKSETALEFTYQYSISSNFYIQPDFQYIINPAGTGQHLPNCFAGILRFGIHF
jgi:porin